MPLTLQQRLIIKESSELYAQEVAHISDLIENENDDKWDRRIAKAPRPL